MSQQDQIEKILKVSQFLKQGFGRRRIAQHLNITEWEARTLIAAVDPIQDPEPQEKTIVSTPSAKLIISDDKPQGSTSIKITSNASVDETPHRLTIRPTTLKVGCISDIHYPYQDQKAEDIALAFMTDYKPDILVWNGDIFDFYAVSSYEKDVKKKMNIQDEIDHGYSRMKTWVNELGPKTKHYFRMGNHEARLSKMTVKLAPALSALRSLNLEDNLDLKALGVKYIPDHKDLYIGNLLFIHGSVVRKHGGNSARGHYEQYGCSVIMGHTHRLAVAYKRNKYGTHTLIENGTLCDFDVEYAQFPDWQHGFTTINFDGDDFSVSQHPIINYKLITPDKVYIA